jgi:hypothetical protein
VSGFVAWVHAQDVAMIGTIRDVATNQPAPARQVLVYTLVIILCVWAGLKIGKKLSKLHPAAARRAGHPAKENEMPAILAAACTGNWQQKLSCGWHQPTGGAANAGYFAGHSVTPWAILAGIIIGLLLLASRSRSRTPATSK